MNETFQRTVSGVILAVLYVFLIFFDNFYYIQSYLVAILFFILAFKEFFDFSNRDQNGSPFFKISIFWGLMVLTLFYLDLAIKKNYFFVDFLDSRVQPLTLLYFCFLAFFLHCFICQIFTRTLNGAIFSTASSLLGVFYIAFPIGHYFSFFSIEGGIYFIVLASVVTIFTDAGAYFGGRIFGKHLAGILTSPKKTIEGYLSGVFLGIISSFILNWIWEFLIGKKVFINGLELFFLSFFLSLLSILGDLLESAMKRDAKIKNSSSSIPGHGGILDLIDALFITIPCLYYYVRIKEIF